MAIGERARHDADRSHSALGAHVEATATASGLMTITVAGELDLASNLLCDLVDASCSRRGIRRLIIDLREVSFIDSAGLCALLSARERTQRSGREFVLLGPSRPVERLLDITRLDGDLPMVADERRAAGDDGRKTA